MSVNKYICLMAPEGSDEVTTSALIPAYTHAGAAKSAAIEYPDLKVVRITQEWEPVDICHNCGATIFKGDYDGDRILKRYGKNYCLECKS